MHCPVLSQSQHHQHHHHHYYHALNDHYCAACRTINEPNDNTINYKNSPQFICVCRRFIYVYEKLPPSHCAPFHTVPLLHCASAPAALKPNYVRLLPLFTHLPRRTGAPKIEISSPSRSKGGCVGVEPDPIPDQSSKPKLSQARIWHCLSCSCCLPMSPSVPQSLLGVFSFFYSFFSGFPFGCLVHSFSLSVLFKLYAFKKRLRINWIISFFYYLFSARNS